MKKGRALGVTMGGLFLSLAAALSLGAGAAAESDAAASTPPAKRVRVARVEIAAETRDVRFAGVARSADRARLSFALGARLAARPVEVGETVATGQVVARLDAREMENAVAAATASLAELGANRRRVEQDLERAERLFAAKAATREEVDRTRRSAEALVAAEEAAGSRLREARRLLSEAVLVAPYEGTVTRVLAEPGEFVRPGQAIVALSGRGALEVEVGLPESMAARLAAGAAVAVELPLAGGRVLAGRVERVGRASEAGGGLFPVVVALAAAEGLLPGMTAEIVFAVGGEDSGLLALPLAAVLNPGGKRPEVFRVDSDGDGDGDGDRGHRVTRVAVEVETLVGDRVAVRGDLAPGTEVVVTGHTSLLDGDRVEVIR